jgi:hypothetical protein
MPRFLIAATASIICFLYFVEPASALVVRDRETCVRVCIIQFNRYGNIYGLMECIGRCSRYGQNSPVIQFRSPGELTRSDCRRAVKAITRGLEERREVRRVCKMHRRLN